MSLLRDRRPRRVADAAQAAVPMRDASAGAAPARADVQAFWEAASCGEVYADGSSLQEQLAEQARTRYALEPFIPAFAGFQDGQGSDVLEIAVGMGADHLRWAQARPRRLVGIDLTRRAIAFTRERLELAGVSSRLSVADAERLPFPDGSFDIVYAWGALHHSPDTGRAVEEVYRVLRPGGKARVMIYHKWSIVGALLWLRYALLRGRPWTGLGPIYARRLESPGTKAYSRGQALRLFHDFRRTRLDVRLSSGDLLEGAAGQRHGGWLLSLARALWPRPLIRRFFRGSGLFLLISAEK